MLRPHPRPTESESLKVCLVSLTQWFSTGGQILPLGDNWQHLETVLVVITGGRNGTSNKWVESRDAAKPPPVHRKVHQPHLASDRDPSESTRGFSPEKQIWKHIIVSLF